MIESIFLGMKIREIILFVLSIALAVLLMIRLRKRGKRIHLLERGRDSLSLRYEDEIRHTLVLDTIGEVIEMYSISQDLEKVLNRVIDGLVRLLGVDICVLELYNPAEHKPSMQICRGRESVDFGDKIRWNVFEKAKSYLVNNLDPFPDCKFLADQGFKALLIAPLKRQTEVIGLIAALTDRSHEFLSREQKLIIAFASYAGLIIENARLSEIAKREQKRMKRELEVASQIQLSLLPKENFRMDGLQVFGRMLPAKEVGGDYFDFIPESENSLGIAIGDVSGKGLPAGLTMVMARSILRSFALTLDSPRKIISNVNHVLGNDMESKVFMSMLYMEWNTLEKLLKYASAGHEHIIIYRFDRQACEVIRSGGAALGLIREGDPFISEGTILMGRNDVIVLYTDGVTEARNEEGDFFTLQRLKKAMETYGDRSGSELLDCLFNEISEFVGTQEQYDDITLLVAKREE